jgi:hypothetical protein
MSAATKFNNRVVNALPPGQGLTGQNATYPQIPECAPWAGAASLRSKEIRIDRGV